MEETETSPIFLILFQKSVVLALAVVFGSYFLLRRNPRIKYHLERLGGPPAIPVLGNSTDFLRPHNEIIPMINRWFKEYGTTFRFWIGSLVPYVLTCDVHVIEKIVSAQIDKGKFDYSLFDDWLGTGLLTAPAKKWTGRRKLLTPSFHFKILEDFMPIFNEQASIFLECFKRDGRDEKGDVFNMYPYISNCTLDIICETAMGKTINAQTSNDNKVYIEAVNGMCALIIDKMLKPWLRIPIISHLCSISKNEKKYLSILRGFTEEVIRSRRAERKSKIDGKVTNDSDIVTSVEAENNLGVYGKQRKAFLDLLLDTADESQQLNDADIREEVDTFMFEGHDTTSANLAFSVLLLAMHPECQRLVQKELDEVFEDDPTRDVTSLDITKMKYLECVVKESLRLFPSVPFVMRQIHDDIPIGDGKLIPKGATVMISIFFTQRLSQHFSDPEKFIPERFSSEQTSQPEAKRHPYAYMPFSAGPRNCIGQKFALMEEKIILAKLFREYSVETDERMETLRPTPDVVLRCENGVHIRLQKRKQNI